MLFVALVVEVEDYDVRLAAVDAGVSSKVVEDIPPDLVSLSVVVPLLTLEEGDPVRSLRLGDRPAVTIAAVMLKSVLLPLIPVELVRCLEATALGTQLHPSTPISLLRGGVRVMKR